MTTLYIAGDSYASISNIQEKGNSWSELLAKSLNAELVNIARPAASNLSIAIQIEWISQRISSDDYAVIMLTDHYRETLPNISLLIKSDKSLLEKHSVHNSQVPSDKTEYSDPAELVSSLFTDVPAHADYQDFFKKWFHPELAYFRDKMVIIGSIALLSRRTEQFLVCSGGFENFADNTAITGKELNISSKNFCEVTSSWLRTASAPVDYINHIDESTHIQLANFLCKKIKNSP
jgi:hypothetical protein